MEDNLFIKSDRDFISQQEFLHLFLDSGRSGADQPADQLVGTGGSPVGTKFPVFQEIGDGPWIIDIFL